MAFKDFVDADMDKVFLNEDEFAETYLIDGVSIRAVKTKNSSVFEGGKQRKNRQRGKGGYGAFSDSSPHASRSNTVIMGIRLSAKLS